MSCEMPKVRPQSPKKEVDACTFRLYSAPSSSIFDMIPGKNTEPQKTKALAYMLSYSDEFRESVVKELLRQWRHKTNRTMHVSDTKTRRMVVCAEEFIAQGSRADIIIRPAGSEPQWVVLIEAKNPSCRSCTDRVQNQLLEYRDELKKQYPNAEIIPVTLTQNAIDLSGDCLSITWEFIFAQAQKVAKVRIVADFLTFITYSAMKTYEEDVLSIPAGKTYEFIKKFGVYKCPDTKAYRHKKSLFLTFRRGRGGVMSDLYPLKAVYILEPDVGEDEVRKLDIPKEDQDAIIAYQKEEQGIEPSDGLHKFYILDKENIVPLPKPAKPQKVGRKHIYYRLCDILKGGDLVPSSQCC